MKEFSNKFNAGNMYVGTPIVIETTDLKEDKVHLNDSGLEKLAGALISDALVALKDVDILRNPDGAESDVELVSSQLSDWSRTPASQRKRTINEEHSESAAAKRAKPTEQVQENSNSELISTLNQFMQQMREDRKTDSDILKKVELSQNTIVEKQKETEEKVEKLTDIVTTDNDIFASMKEDVDASENEMMRNTVIVKKLVTKEKIPVDKKDLSKFIQEQGRNLVKEILGDGAENALMWGVVEGLKKKGKEAWVNQNLNKPNIQIKEGGKIVKTLTFMQAMKEHSKIISAKVISDVSKSAAWNFKGQMERYFIVLKD